MSTPVFQTARSSSSERPAVRDPQLAIDNVMRWAVTFDTPNRKAMLVIPGASRAERTVYVQRYLTPQWEPFRRGSIEDLGPEVMGQWLTRGVYEDFVARVSVAQVPDECRVGMPIWFPPFRNRWEILWGLVAIKEFVVEEPLRSLVDRGSFLAHDFYRLLWEARFLASENVNLNSTQALVNVISQWMQGNDLSREGVALLDSVGVVKHVETEGQQLDLLCMLLTLAAQNGILNRYILGFDSLEEALDNPLSLRHLNRLIDAVDRWIKIGSCPIGVLIGFDNSSENMARLRERNPKLAVRVEAGLTWTEEKSDPNRPDK